MLTTSNFIIPLSMFVANIEGAAHPDIKYYTAKLLFNQSPTRHSHYTVTGQ